tara:strand:+ start:153 stop:569 length:417 start_codon:yes stop_codon:yes gene_type:complete
MKIIPKDVTDVINNNKDNRLIYSNDLFVLIKDIDHIDEDIFHYTAWCKKNISSLLELQYNQIKYINDIKYYLINNNIIENYDIYIHFPPTWWRLHIHFISKKHKHNKNIFENVFYMDDIENNLRIDKEYYRKKVKIIS